MAKIPTFPPIIDSVFRVDLAIFKKWGLLKPFLKSEGTYQDVSDDVYKGQIDFFLHTGSNPYCIFSGCFRGVPFEKTIQIEAKRSNLAGKVEAGGNGMVYYFICPITGKRCRKLYVFGGHFGSAKAFGLYYPQQVLSKKQISWEAFYETLSKLEKLNEKMYSTKTRRSYNGKITRRFARMIREYDRLDSMLAGFSKQLGEQYSEEIERIETESGFKTIERKYTRVK